MVEFDVVEGERFSVLALVEHNGCAVYQLSGRNEISVNVQRMRCGQTKIAAWNIVC